MSSENRWRIHLRNLETRIGIGIHDHERKPQRVIVNVVIESIYSALPQSIDECFNYDHVRQILVNDWPNRSHVDLLETCVSDLLMFIFRASDNVVSAKVSVCKPDIFPEVEAVGVEAQWTRADFERLSVKA